jgi:hypothetical protein
MKRERGRVKRCKMCIFRRGARLQVGDGKAAEEMPVRLRSRRRPPFLACPLYAVLRDMVR